MKILLLGKGISNNALNQFMLKYGIAHDYKGLEEDISYDYDLVIKGPGINYQNNVIDNFIKLNVKVICDIEFIAKFIDKNYIAITGTNGKTTTTKLIENLLNTKHKAIACGNIGYPFAQAAIDYKDYNYFVIEASSFELKGTIDFKPNISVILNINIAHQDYHLSFLDYYNSKQNITINQRKNDVLIYNYDDYYVAKIAAKSKARKYSFSLKNTFTTAYFKNNGFYYMGQKIISSSKYQCISDGLKYDILASLIVAKILGISNRNIKRVINNYKQEKYRFEKVDNYIYNDAKSTNIYSTINALDFFKNDMILLICGGYDRGEDLEPLCMYSKNIKKVYAYGETKHKLKLFFSKIMIDCEEFDILNEAVIKALNEHKKEIILYSPMFASYDQYNSYLERGKEFYRIIKKNKKPN